MAQDPTQRLLHQARFLKSAQNVEQCPPDAGFEVAFAGRSNAGKSSAIKISGVKNPMMALAHVWEIRCIEID